MHSFFLVGVSAIKTPHRRLACSLAPSLRSKKHGHPLHTQPQTLRPPLFPHPLPSASFLLRSCQRMGSRSPHLERHYLVPSAGELRHFSPHLPKATLPPNLARVSDGGGEN